ncbi:MAG TPA: glycosyltransferase family 87 protein [Solirubrobacteraceae bacterium]|nr:glycosyltransferase family 87 protein [Solirubrobacteraceae bacterium]
MSARGRPLEVVPETGTFELPPLELASAPGRVITGGARTGALAARAGLAGVLLTGMVVALSAAQTNDLVPQSVRPMPGWLAGVFANTGVGLGPAALIILFALMFASYVLAVRGAAELSPRVVLASITALAAIFLLAPVILSTDVFSYQAYGRMGTLYGTNPYLHGPSTIRLDPLYPFIGSKWVSTPTAYGPLFTAVSYPLAHLDISASVGAYKSLAALGFLATVALVWSAARLRGLDPGRAAMIVGLNPLTVVWGLGGGHNDLLMLAAMAAAIYVLLQQRQATGAAMIAVATAIKLTAAVVLPFALVRPHADRRRLLLGAGIASALVATLGFALFGIGQIHLFATLQQNQAAGNWQSIPGFISTELGLGGVGRLVGILLGLVFAGVTVWLLVLVHRGRLDWIDGAGWATVAMLLTASSLLPWYIAWLTPLAALSTDLRLRRWTLAMTGVMIAINMLAWVPNGSTLLGR